MEQGQTAASEEGSQAEEISTSTRQVMLMSRGEPSQPRGGTGGGGSKPAKGGTHRSRSPARRPGAARQIILKPCPGAPQKPRGPRWRKGRASRGRPCAKSPCAAAPTHARHPRAPSTRARPHPGACVRPAACAAWRCSAAQRRPRPRRPRGAPKTYVQPRMPAASAARGRHGCCCSRRWPGWPPQAVVPSTTGWGEPRREIASPSLLRTRC